MSYKENNILQDFSLGSVSEGKSLFTNIRKTFIFFLNEKTHYLLWAWYISVQMLTE